MNHLQSQESSSRRGQSVDEARDLCELVLGLARADQTRVTVNSGWRGFTRTATNRITTAGGSTNTTVRIMSVFGKRVASVTTNNLDQSGLEQAVAESEALARLSPEDPEYLPELGPQEYENVEGYYSRTGGLAPVARGTVAPWPRGTVAPVAT